MKTMMTSCLARAAVLPSVGIWVVPLLLLGWATAAQGQAAVEAGVQVLTRGPVHEAFAEASMTGATAGIVITKAPPDPIAELPPDQRPEGANIAWIPGYWSWDDDRAGFIWVSGVWRDLPPGRQWVPGYWTPVAGGSQWISGFWGDAAQTEVTYLPPPPEPLEAGPSSPAPAPDNQWTPGSWVWQETAYAWQPGYWVAPQPDWVWAPAHYTWTPRGYVYVPGYWDHDIVHRGVMFAPVYYDQPIYARPNYSYSPATVIDLGVMAACLFVQPRSHHYYYGDYYDPRYEERGLLPWYSKDVRRYGDDPIYVHYRAEQLRHDPDWDAHVHEQFQFRREHVDARPPQTLALQASVIDARKAGAPPNVVIGRTLAEAAKSKTMALGLKPVSMDERKQIQTRGIEVHKLQAERAKIETAPAAAGKSEKAAESAQPVKARLRASPVAAKPLAKTEKGNAPPPAPATPKPQAAEAKVVQEKPKKVETKAALPQAQEKPKRVEAKPETIKPATVPEKIAPKPEPAKRERVPVKTETKSRAPQAVEPTTPKKLEAKPKPQVQSAPKTVEPKREAPKPEVSKPEVKSQKAEPKAQPRRTETKKPKAKPAQPPSADDNKNKKNEEK